MGQDHTKIRFTAIIGDYDSLIEAPPQDGWRHICFTDQFLESETWEIRNVTHCPKRHRQIKTCPHLFLPPHEFSLWTDANLDVSGDLNRYAFDEFVLMEHPDRDSIYEEAEACIKRHKDCPEVIRNQIAQYIGIPENLAATGILFRRNTVFNRYFGELWWSEIKRHSCRDQISFSYLAHTEGLMYSLVPFLEGAVRNAHKN